VYKDGLAALNVVSFGDEGEGGEALEEGGDGGNWFNVSWDAVNVGPRDRDVG
jgi:hypothetical protein